MVRRAQINETKIIFSNLDILHCESLVKLELSREIGTNFLGLSAATNSMLVSSSVTQ